MIDNNQNNQPNYAQYRDFSDFQGDTTEYSSENEKNCILANNFYKIKKIPSQLKNKDDNSDDNSIPRILYDKKNKKYCYQLDYNTFIFLTDNQYKNNKKVFEIKDNRLLFFKKKDHKLYGRGEFSNENNYDLEEYENVEDYEKKYGELDRNGEFKKPRSETQEIKMYMNIDDYFRRKCYLYKNMDDFKKNKYTSYLDIYDYYFKDHINNKIKKFEKLLPSNYEKNLNITHENIKTYEERYNSLYNENSDLIKLNNNKNKLITLKDIKEEDIKDYEKAEQFVKEYFNYFINNENEGKFKFASMCATTGSIADEIENLTRITKILYYIKEEINQLLEYNDLEKVHKYEKEDIEKLKQIKEKTEKLWSVFCEPLVRLHKNLINYIKLYGKVITHPIFLKINYLTGRLERLNNYVCKYTIYENSPVYNSNYYPVNSKKEPKEKYTLYFPNYKKNEYIKELIEDNITRQHDIVKNLYYEGKTIKKQLSEIPLYIKKYKEIFRPENKLNLKENINEKSDIKDKKMLNLFICYVYDIIDCLNSLEKNIKNLKNDKFLKHYPTITEKTTRKKLSNYILEQNKITVITKEDENILLKDLEKILNLYMDLFLKDKDVIPELEDFNDECPHIKGKSYFKNFDESLNPRPYTLLRPFIKELLFDLLKQTKKYIGKDKKTSYENLYNLCKALKEKVKKPEPETKYSRDLYEITIGKCILANKEFSSSENSNSFEDSISESEINANIEQKIEAFQKKIKKHKNRINNFFKNSNKYHEDNIYFYIPLVRLCERTLPDIEKYKNFIKKFKNHEKISLFENKVKSLEELLLNYIDEIVENAKNLYTKKFKDKLINDILDLYKAEDSATITVNQMVEKLNNFKKEKRIETTVKIFKSEIDKHKEYIKNIQKCKNKQEFLYKLNHLCDNIIPVTNQYDKFIENFKDFNEEIKQFENDVNLFKLTLVNNLENLVKEVKNEFKKESLVINKLQKALEKLTLKNSSDIENDDYNENLNKIIEEPKEQNEKKELGYKKFKEDLKEKQIENIDNKNKNKELSSKEFKEDLNKIEKNNKELKNKLKTRKEEFNKINESSQSKNDIK